MARNISTLQHDALLEMLREVRARQGVTQGALADALGFRQTDISKSERGVRRLDVLELRAWINALGLSFVEFSQQLDERLAGMETLQRHASSNAASVVRGATVKARRRR